MPIKVACACGKKLAVKDELAGKKVKCPACQKLISIPKPKVQAESLDDEWDLGDSAEEDFEDEPADAPVKSRGRKSSPSRGSVSRKGNAKGKAMKSSGSNRGLLIGLSAGGGVLVVALLTWLLWPAAPANNANDNAAGTAVAGGAEPANPIQADGGTTSTPNLTAVGSATPTANNGVANSGVAATRPAETSVTMTAPVASLPRALTQLPEWLKSDAPFNVQQYWITVPSEQNAAPLYLDALYEFVPQLAVCFSPEVQQQRTAIAIVRGQRSAKLQTNWYAYQSPTRDPAERDAVLQEHALGFQKLAEAQKRIQCVVDVGWDMPSQAILMVAAREAIRVAQLQVERDIERGELDAAIRLTGMMLRLSQDLRHRTPNVIQSIADAMQTLAVQSLVIPVLKSPNLKPSQCDELLRVLTRHETALRANDPYLARLRAEYLLRRVLLHDMQHQAGEFADAQFSKAFGATNATREAALMSALTVDRSMWLAIGSEMPKPEIGMLLERLLRGMTPADFDAAAAVLKEKYQVQANAAEQPFRARATAIGEWQTQKRKDWESLMADAAKSVPPNTPREQAQTAVFEALDKKLTEGTQRGPILAAVLMMASKFENDLDAIGPFANSDAYLRTRLAAAQALVALRRWYGTHAEPPPDISLVCREAGLSAVPRDPFGDGPLRIATFAAETPIQHRFQKDLKVLAGETVIYSVGPDGVDDKALKDFGYGPGEPGDWLFRLEIAQKAIPVTPVPAATPIQ